MNAGESELRALVERSLAEDVGTGDITSIALVAERAKARARLVAKQSTVLAGTGAADMVFECTGGCRVTWKARDGARLSPGQVFCTIEGNARSMLAAERTALNFLMRLSGIATLTARFVRQLRGTGCRLLDTRKTTPGLRRLEKAAVLAGGGHNHRIGLFDGILIKDNHLAVVGSVRRAVEMARKSAPATIKVEVECKNLAQVRQALEAGADMIMLDNMPVGKMNRAVEIVGGRVPLEASGNITLENVRRVALTGVDYVSAGAITHSAPSADISMEFETR